MKKLTFTLLFALMAIVSAQAAKVYLKIGEGRVTAESNLAVWVWEGKNNFCTNGWPGDKLTEKETIEGADYFVYTVNTEGSYNILFNNNQSSGTKQTKDIKGITGDCTFVLNNEWDGENWSYTKTEGAPGAVTPEPVETYTVQLRGAKYSWGTDAPTFTYNKETGEYVYEETVTAKLAGDFKITIVDTNTWLHNDEFKGTLNNEWGFKDLYSGGSSANNMKITDAADYDKITLTVKKEGETWKLKIVGVKTDKVQITGEFNGWSQVDMVSNPNGTYTYEVEENMAALSEGFCIVINGVHYAGKIALDLDGDAVDLQGNPGHGNDLTLIAEGDVASVILTVAKVGDKWTVKAATGKTSSVAGVDAAGVVIAAANGEIVVEGAQNVAVYTAAGALVSTDVRTRVAAGLYIVRADNVVKKVIVK
ncbi:MAG: starch-binding protein [Prevotella sp.]|nr:starch-binding protein [Prevotella sp.]MBS7207644.1 starch-binding protein [Prevotella sp.]